MTTFLYGVAGTLAVLALLAAGVALGWVGHKSFVKHLRPSMPPQEAEKRKKLEAEHAAFQMLQNYSPERAYGIPVRQDHLGGEG